MKNSKNSKNSRNFKKCQTIVKSQKSKNNRQKNYILLHPGKLRPYSIGAVWRAGSSDLDGFGNFGRLQYRIQEGGHLSYEG